ncbi:MAG: zinc ABC transporter substrate-binding protein [Campylobacterales bacterium]|nr:zinc ABC transporter substrate-binding protein [Campylobacterales bacterium]
MKKILWIFAFITSWTFAQVNVVASYTYLGEITKAIGGDDVNVKVLASPKLDPHFIIPKPSLIPTLSRADMLVANGAGLEIGWLPPLLRNANNPKIAIGSQGFVDASQAVALINKPATVSRAYGDVHPEGNPHFSTDPHNIVPIARMIANKLSNLDPQHHSAYQNRLADFTTKWNAFLTQFDSKMHSCKGKKVVQYHQLYNYLFNRYGIKIAATIEPLPGITPSSKHTMEVIRTMQQQHVHTILQDPYHEKKSASFIASKTGANVKVIPHDVGSIEGTETLKTFYETIANLLCQ